MKRAALIGLVLLLCPAWNALGQQSDKEWEPFQEQKENHSHSGQPLTDDSIVKLVKIGFSDETILAMINNQPGKYSLGADDIVALKRAGVSEKVITAMLNKPADTAAPPHDTKASNDAAPVIPSQIGLYAFSDGVLHRIEGRVTSFERSGSRLASAATLGIHAARVNTQIPGSRAHVTVGARPIFYYRAAPKEEAEGGLDLVLTQLTVKNGRRQFEVGAQGLWRASNGISVRHQLDFDASQIEPGLYKLTPTQELETGQYAFYLLRGFEHASMTAGRGFVYDFQVE